MGQFTNASFLLVKKAKRNDNDFVSSSVSKFVVMVFDRTATAVSHTHIHKFILLAFVLNYSSTQLS